MKILIQTADHNLIETLLKEKRDIRYSYVGGVYLGFITNKDCFHTIVNGMQEQGKQILSYMSWDSDPKITWGDLIARYPKRYLVKS